MSTKKTTYCVQGYMTPHRKSKRLRGWQTFYAQEFTDIESAKTAKAAKLSKTDQYDQLRIIQRTVTEVVIIT